MAVNEDIREAYCDLPGKGGGYILRDQETGHNQFIEADKIQDWIEFEILDSNILEESNGSV